jgi:hypothetical protein
MKQFEYKLQYTVEKVNTRKSIFMHDILQCIQTNDQVGKFSSFGASFFTFDWMEQ